MPLELDRAVERDRVAHPQSGRDERGIGRLKPEQHASLLGRYEVRRAGVGDVVQ